MEAIGALGCIKDGWMCRGSRSQRAGIPVMFCPDRLPNFCILDQRLVWYGGLNPLGRMPDGESCLRMDAPDVAAELMEFLRGIMPSG